MRVVLRNVLLLCMVVPLVLACATTSTTDAPIGPNKKAAEINTQLGMRYLDQGELALADKKLRRALKQDPSSSTTNWVFALLLEKLGEDVLAEEHFRKAISLNPKDSRAHNNYGTFLCNQNRIEESEKEFLKAIENPLYSTPDAAYANAGICVLKIPDKIKAEQYFKDCLRINPRQSEALFHMAKLSFERQEFVQTIDYIQRYEQVAKHNSLTLWVAFQSESNVGNKDKANVYANHLKKSFPASKEARLLAETYWNAGRTKQ